MSGGRRGEAGGREFRRPPQLVQIVGSILVALAIAAIAVAVVTAHFGSTPALEIEAREERLEAREDAREEREEAAAERAEDNSGSG